MKSPLIASDISNTASTKKEPAQSGNKLNVAISSTAILVVLFLLAFELFVSFSKTTPVYSGQEISSDGI